MRTNALLSLMALCAATNAAAVPRAADSDMRLIKLSEDGAPVWMTEQEKLENLIQKDVRFIDITETQDLEDIVSNNRASRTAFAAAAFPAGPAYQAEAKPFIAKLVQNNTYSTVKTMSDMYNRYYKGQYSAQASQMMVDLVTKAASGNSAITIKTFKHTYDMPSVIARIPGKSNNTVVVGAHFDSINQRQTSGVAPGADDNASGSATIMEVLRVLADGKFQPQNSVEFHWYSGEEGGLLGSRDVWKQYAKDKAPVLAMLNQDMTGYSPKNVIGLYTDYVDKALTAFVQTLVPAYTSLQVTLTKCGYACSDHASARDAGYPSALVNEAAFADSYQQIHTPKDTIDIVNFAHVLEHTKLSLGFVIEASHFNTTK